MATRAYSVVAVPLSPEQRAVMAAPNRGSARRVVWADLGALDEARLQAAVEQVLAAHSVLQHDFVPDGDGGRLQQADRPPPTLQHQHLQGQAFGEWCSQLATGTDCERVIQAVLLRTEAGPRLILAASELVADHASLQALVQQVASSYAGAALDAELFQYHQYVEWREELASGEDAEQGQRYWNAYLQSAATPLPPRLSTRRRGTSPVRLRCSRPIDAASITAAAQSFETSSEVLLQSVWWLLLARLTGFTRSIGGWQHDCRHDYELMQGAVGVFDKILPVIIAAAADERFADWLARSAAVLRTHVDAQEYWPVATPPLSAHLAVGFGFATSPSIPGWEVHELASAMDEFELALHATLRSESAEVTLHADAARYSERALQRLLEQFTTLLERALEEPMTRLDALCVIGPDERRALLQLPAAAIDFGSQTLAAHITGWAHTTPDAPAIESDGHVVSYGELAARANRLAHWMQAQGVQRGDLVALNLPRSSQWLIAMLAAWQAGAGYLPLEPEWPAARRAAVVGDAEPVLVLHEERATFVTGVTCQQQVLGEVDASVYGDAPPSVPATLQDIAYVLYTSGSTGKPKGAVIEHGALLNYVAAASAALDLGGARRWALTSSVAADLGNTALFGALFNGACLSIAGAQHTNDAEAFARFMREQRIDGLKIVPSHLEALLECTAPCLPRTLVLGGEAAPLSLIQRIRQLSPECALYNHYGPTETTVGVMVHPVRDDAAGSDVLPLSHVLANNRVLVLDESLQLVPSGALGQVYVGGAQLCRGYLRQAASGAFIDDPFQPGERLYRTGDLAYVRPEGGLQLAGRADHQVKIRGFRIEPAEVEAALLCCANIRQAVVLVAAGSGERAAELVACVVNDLAGQGPEAIAAEISAHLPAYMLPARYVLLAEFPRLANGKVDRLALTASLSAPVTVSSQTAPRSELEAALAKCMAELLGRDSVGIDQDFFALGGQSLLAIKLAARIARLLDVEVEPGLVIDCPTVAALAERLASRSAAQLSRDVQSVQLAAGGTGTALYCFPGTLGNGSEFAPLAQALRGERAVTGFVCHTLGPERWQRQSIVELAGVYARHIEARSAGQGCALLGWSFGGDLAYETARQLQGRVAVKFLGVVDVTDREQGLVMADVAASAAMPQKISQWLEQSAMRAQWQRLLDDMSDAERGAVVEFLATRPLPADGPAFDSGEYELWVLLRLSWMKRRYFEAGVQRLELPLHSWTASATAQDASRRIRQWAALSLVQHEQQIAGTTHKGILSHADFIRGVQDALKSVD